VVPALARDNKAGEGNQALSRERKSEPAGWGSELGEKNKSFEQQEVNLYSGKDPARKSRPHN
jgi:hypothetical protein